MVLTVLTSQKSAGSLHGGTWNFYDTTLILLSPRTSLDHGYLEDLSS
jgi:hypothetical protein